MVDTSYFRGNYPESCSLEACAVEGHPTPEELMAAAWTEILPNAHLPTRATIGVNDLGDGVLIELVASAAKG